MSRDKDSLISEGKREKKEQVMQMQSLATSHQQTNVQLVSK